MKAVTAWVLSLAVIVGMVIGVSAWGKRLRSSTENAIVREFQAAKQRDRVESLSAKPGPSFKPIQLRGAFPGVEQVKVVTASQAADQVRDGDSVIGVVVGDEARAYPINMMASPEQELLNDTLGGQPIAVTWCGLCESGIVYDRRVGAETLSFSLPGMIWENNMVMTDSQTKSLWSQSLGRGMEGAYKDHKLKILPSVVTDWGAWKATHPETTLLSLPLMANEFVQSYSYDASKTGPNRFVLVLNLDDRSRAWPLKFLTAQDAINDVIGDTAILVLYDDQHFTANIYYRKLGDHELEFRRVKGKVVDTQTQSVWDPFTGVATNGPLEGQQLERAPGFMILRENWLNLHPDTSLWNPAISSIHGGP